MRRTSILMEHNSEPSKIYEICVINRMYQSTYICFMIDSKYLKNDKL